MMAAISMCGFAYFPFGEFVSTYGDQESAEFRTPFQIILAKPLL